MISSLLRQTLAPALLAAVALPHPRTPATSHPAPRTSHAPAHAAKPAPDPRLWSSLRFRNLGPMRAGRIAAVTGAVGQPGTFYAGLPAGGVWKTTSAGATWYPVFDSVRSVSSVGAIEVAPSDANVVYAGTGDIVTGGAINEGDGMYKSTDAGHTWQHVGLDSTKQIPSILIDTRDANTVLVAAQGDLHARSGARGVFRSSDGGRSWTRTLFVDDETGIQKLARANDVPDVIFAATARHFAPNPTPNTPQVMPTPGGTALYKSTDGGKTFTTVTGTGLPALTGRISVAVAMNTNAQRVFLIQNSGLWRSDDGGASWKQVAANDRRIRNGQGGYNCGVYVDPKNPDVVYTISTSSYKSTDGGNTFTGFKGAPGGDDPQQLWIDPTNGQRMLLGLDQGAVVTLDGGATWSSWYNQSTEQVYHISIDESFPSWIYATQQDAGAIRIRTRGNYGAVTPFDWNSVNGWEWGTIIADPLDPNTVYASGSGIVKISYPSEQWINVSPATDPNFRARNTSSQPMTFAPWNRHELLAATQYVMSTTDGGQHWTKISPDLALRTNIDSMTPGARGAIESMTASPVANGMIWVGTGNGIIQVTRDHGKTWTDVSVPNLPLAQRGEVLTVEASSHDANTAYAVIDFHRIGDYAPHVFRTRDGGRSWTTITNGLPASLASGAFARVVREDPTRAGLLFLGTESGVYTSLDAGDHWAPLGTNLPVTSYRDIKIHGNDLVVGTYGRGIWVLDDMSMLRQLAANAATSEPARLFKPGDAVRVRRNVNADTPLPPEVPHGFNPADGVIIDYWLANAPSREITLDVIDKSGRVIRHMSSVAAAPVTEAATPPHPNFWVAPPFAIPANAGANRTNWDLRYDAPPAFSHSFEINANPGLTPASPEGPLAPPGAYTLRLNVDGRSYTQTAIVRPDPRSPATVADINAQTTLLVNIYDAMRAAYAGAQQLTTLRAALAPAANITYPAELTAAGTAFGARLDSLGGLDAARTIRQSSNTATPPLNFRAITDALVNQLNAQDNGDHAPTPGALAAFAKSCSELKAASAAWQQVLSRDLVTYNAVRTRLSVPALAGSYPALTLPKC